MKTEKTLLIILLVAIILRIFHIPGGSILLLLSLLTFALIYMPLGFYFLSDKKTMNKTIGFSILSGWFLSTAVIGILFKIMHWPGAMIVMFIGLLSCVPVGIISYLKNKNTKDADLTAYYKNILIRIVIVVAFSLILFLIN